MAKGAKWKQQRKQEIHKGYCEQLVAANVCFCLLEALVCLVDTCATPLGATLALVNRLNRQHN